MKGRHVDGPRTDAERAAVRRRAAEPVAWWRWRRWPRVVRGVVFWGAMAGTVALVVVMVVGVVGLWRGMEHPEEGGWSGWQCAAKSGECDGP